MKAHFICPKCKKFEPHKVVDSRSYPEYIRRRILFNCGTKLTTYETIKKDGR